MPIERDAIWQELRALRAAPVGRAARDPERRAVFASALRQAQELATAVETAGYATKPLPLFYCLSQGLRAVAAAQIDDAAWRVVGHGARVMPQGGVLDTTVAPRPARRPDGRDALSAIQTVDDTPPLSEPVSLGELWLATPGAPELPEDVTDGNRPLILHLPFHAKIRRANIEESRVEAAVAGLSIDLNDAELAEALEPYPSLAGGESVRDRLEDPQRAEMYVVEHPQVVYNRYGRTSLDLAVGKPWVETAPVLSWPFEGRGEEAHRLAFERLAPVAVEGRDDHRVVWPRLAGSPAPSFLALRWCLLLALSSLVRYEPAVWTAAIDPDQSPLAVPLEQVCDAAESFVPAILRLMLRDGSE